MTVGPTYEKIDPVRFIGNFSSGKMGFAIAEELAKNGADVFLISGPVSLKIQHPRIQRIDVLSAEEMYRESVKRFSDCHCAIMTAAVSDFTPLHACGQKLKRDKENYNFELKPTKDIAETLGEMKTKNQILIGFALETTNEEMNANLKLEKKNLDVIVLNSLNDAGAGFRHDTNKISMIRRSGEMKKFKLKTKKEVAKDIVAELIDLYKK